MLEYFYKGPDRMTKNRSVRLFSQEYQAAHGLHDERKRIHGSQRLCHLSNAQQYRMLLRSVCQVV